MNAIEKALYAKLSAASALTSLLSGGSASIYSPAAPQGASAPYVVFSKQANTPHYTNTGVAYEDALYQVKGIVQSPSGAAAGTIASAIDTALNMQALSITGYTHLLCRRESDVDYPEHVEGQTWQHRGAMYRIWADPS